MKMLISLVVLLCVAGAINGQALDNDCGTGKPDCGANLACDGTTNKCKTKIGADCSAAVDKCLTDATCPTSGNKVCTCNDKFVPTIANDKCELKIDQTCVTAEAKCLTGTVCEGGPPTKCTCQGATASNNDQTKCVKKVGETCGAAAECVANTDCVGTPNKCQCKANFAENSDKSQCLKKLGQQCGGDGECSGGANTKCVGSKCACKDATFLAMYDNSDCRKAPGQECTKANQDECGENAECKTNTASKDVCTCKSGSDSKAGQRCGILVGKTCAESNLCVANAECKKKNDADTTKQCLCMTDYTDDGSKYCKKSSGASAVASVMLVLAAFVTSRWI